MSQDENARRRTSSDWLALAVGLFAGGVTALYVSAHLSAWAAPILWLALAVGLLAAIAYLTHRLPEWLAGATITYTGSLTFLLYIVVAYHARLAFSPDLVRLLPLSGMLGLSVIALLLIWRRRVRGKHMRVVAYDIVSHTPGGPPNPHTLERRMVYADESMLQRRALLLAAGAGALGAGLRWASVSHVDSMYLVLLGVLLMIASVHLALAVTRLFMSGPTLVIGPEGILDNASLVATGSGLLRWDEISRVAAVSEKVPSGSSYHFLRIYLDNGALILARQPLWKRMLGGVAGGFSPRWMTVYRGLLDEAPETLALEIMQYAQAYAVTGWSLPPPPDGPKGNGDDIWRM